MAQSGHPDWARQILERSDRVDGRLAEDVDREIEAMYGGSPAVSKPGQVKVGRASFQEDPFDYRI